METCGEILVADLNFLGPMGDCIALAGRKQAAVQYGQIMHTSYIGELNTMHFKQTFNKIINLPQESSNYTSCHELVHTYNTGIGSFPKSKY